MKYQQLDNLESGWKWQYLIHKHKMGETITRYLDQSEDKAAIEKLLALESDPLPVSYWIEQHLFLDLRNKLKQAIRAKRKRHFNAEKLHTRKKSIDLDYRVWERLSERAQSLDSTLSDTIEYLLSEEKEAEEAL
jgi:hypothetical protein